MKFQSCFLRILKLLHSFHTWEFQKHSHLKHTKCFETWLGWTFWSQHTKTSKFFHIWETQNVLKHGWAKHYEANMPKLQSFSHLKHGLVKVSETLQNLKLVFQALESFEVVWNMQNLKKKNQSETYLQKMLKFMWNILKHENLQLLKLLVQHIKFETCLFKHFGTFGIFWSIKP